MNNFYKSQITNPQPKINRQLSLAIARLINGQHDYSFHSVDQQALCSLISFVLAVFLGAKIGDKIGSKTRVWLFLGTFIQTLFTIAAAVLMWEDRESSVADARYDPAWSGTLSFAFTGFLSASMGLQGVMAKRVGTHFSTTGAYLPCFIFFEKKGLILTLWTVALTTTWCELMADPKLLDVRRLVASRDHKIMTVALFVLGGFAGRTSLDQIGSARTLAIAAGIRLITSVWWLFAPAKN
jgi:hypothetical protein